MYVPVVLPVFQHVVHSCVVSEEEKEVHAQGAGDSQGISVKDYHRGCLASDTPRLTPENETVGLASLA